MVSNSLVTVVTVVTVVICWVISVNGEWIYPCGSAPQNKYPFCDESLSFEQRSSDYVSQLTIDDMAIL